MTPDPSLVRYLAYARTLPGYKPKPPRRYRCRFCRRWTMHTCAWIVERPRRVDIAEINPYDILCGEGFLLKPTRDRWTVLDSERIGQRTIRLTVVGRRRGEGPYCGAPPVTAQRGVTMFAGETVWVLRPTRCGAPCCSHHRRHPGPGVDYCADHWRAWEQTR